MITPSTPLSIIVFYRMGPSRVSQGSWPPLSPLVMLSHSSHSGSIWLLRPAVPSGWLCSAERSICWTLGRPSRSWATTEWYGHLWLLSWLFVPIFHSEVRSVYPRVVNAPRYISQGPLKGRFSALERSIYWQFCSSVTMRSPSSLDPFGAPPLLLHGGHSYMPPLWSALCPLTDPWPHATECS